MRMNGRAAAGALAGAARGAVETCPGRWHVLVDPASAEATANALNVR